MKSTFYVAPVLLVILPNVLSSEEKAGLLDKLIINSPDPFFPCKLNVDELPPNQPLYVNSKTKRIILPTRRKNTTVLYAGSHTIGVAYPKNGILKLSQYSCSRRRLFKTGYTKHHPQTLKIEEPLPVVALRRGAQGCSHTTWYTPGFLVDDVRSPLMSNCYNETAHFSVAATHKIDGRVVTDEIIPWTVDTDIKGGGDEEKTLKQFYGIRHQQVMVVMNHGMAAALKVFGNKEQYLVPLRLVPAKDLVLPSLGTAASAFSNIVPIWSSNGPSWATAENYVRRVAKKLQETITVHTGIKLRAFVTVSSSSGSDEVVMVGSTPIPQYIAKVVRHKNSCFVLVMSNDIQVGQVRCNQQCGIGFLDNNICCTNYKDLRKNYPKLIPTIDECRKFLDIKSI